MPAICAYCPNCGTTFAPNQEWCPACGRSREVPHTRLVTQADLERAEGFQVHPPPPAPIVWAHQSAYRFLRHRQKLWVPTWAWIACIALLCLSVGWLAGWLTQARRPAPAPAVQPAPIQTEQRPISTEQRPIPNSAELERFLDRAKRNHPAGAPDFGPVPLPVK